MPDPTSASKLVVARRPLLVLELIERPDHLVTQAPMHAWGRCCFGTHLTALQKG